MPFRFERSPAAAPDLATSLARLAALAGAKPPPVSGSERDAFVAALPALSTSLAPLLPALGGSLLARLLAGPRFDGEPEARHLPKEARKALKAGEVFASSDADVWILEAQKDGTARISHAHPESFRVLGETMGEWLASEARAVESARAPRPAKAAKATKPATKPAKPAKPAKVAVGKPAIDAALARLATGDLTAKLAATAADRNDTRWHYLLRAVRACGPVWAPDLLAKLEGRLLGRVLTGRLHDSEDEACLVEEGDTELDGVNPIYVGRYPKAARAVLTDGHIVASSGPEVWVILREAKGAKMSWNILLHHAGPEGFEELGNLEAWLAHEVERFGAP